MSPTPESTTVWVLAYILRFPYAPGEWAQVCLQGYQSEEQARAARVLTGSPAGYQICRVEVKT